MKELKNGEWKIRSSVIGLLLILLAGLSGWAQSNESIREPHRFEEPAWVELTKDLDYSPFGKIPDEEQRKRSSPNLESDDPSERQGNPAVRVDSPLAANIVKFVIILAAAIALAVLLKHLLGFGGLPRNRKVNIDELDQARLEQIEENLHEAELEGFIRQAVEQGQYALAVRLYFLAILQELSIREAIRWKRNKTNRAYLGELRNQPDYEDFRRVVGIFERIWYGAREPDLKAFRKMEGTFVGFLERLRKETEQG